MSLLALSRLPTSAVSIRHYREDVMRNKDPKPFVRAETADEIPEPSPPTAD
jgi:hypothetical protein